MLKNLAKKVYLGRHSIIAAILALSGAALVACSSGGGSSGGSTNAAVTTKAFGLAARAQDQAITLSWPRINDAKKYNLYWSLTSGVTKNTGTKIADTTAPYEHRGLSNGVPVYYVYTVETSAGEGEESLEITLVPGISAAGSPNYVEASGRSERVELIWCCVANATSYNIYGKTAHGDIFGDPILKDATSPAVITLLQNSQSYYFAVTAIVNGVESPVSNETVALTYAPEVFALTPGAVPERPRHVYAFAGHQQVTIGANDQKDALRYTIYWNTTGDVTEANEHLSNVALPYSHLELEDNKKYYYRIAAQNQHGSSTLSSEISNIPNNDTINDLAAGIIDIKLRDCIKKYALENGWKYQRELEWLKCKNEKTLDLAGLEKFSNLSQLDLNQDYTVSIITGLNSLTQLANLNELSLLGDSIGDLSFLSGLMNLTYLDLRNNNITDTHLTTLKELAGQSLLDLKTLGISDNPITSLAPLAPLVNLEYLYVENSLINDLAPLSGLLRLTELWVKHNPNDPINRISTLEPLRNLTALTDLRFENNAIDASGLEPLSKLTNLQRLFFTNNNVVSLDALKGMAQLREIQAGHNKISDIHLTNISGLPKLEVLNLESNAVVKDLSSLATLTTLRELNLSNNQVDNLFPLTAMTSLATLNLNGNLVVNVRPLANLYSLQNLNLSNNQIGGANVGRVDWLADLTRATYIGLGGNSAMSCVELVTLVEARGSPPVDLDGVPGSVDVPTAGVNCTNPP